MRHFEDLTDCNINVVSATAFNTSYTTLSPLTQNVMQDKQPAIASNCQSINRKK